MSGGRPAGKCPASPLRALTPVVRLDDGTPDDMRTESAAIRQKDLAESTHLRPQANILRSHVESIKPDALRECLLSVLQSELFSKQKEVTTVLSEIMRAQRVLSDLKALKETGTFAVFWGAF